MKTIILVRHGKSSWEYDVIDRERPLKSRGENDAELVANQFVKINDFIPKNIFSSPANRALSTCKIFVRLFGISQNSINVDECLYDFVGENVIDFIKKLPNDYDDVMIFGHNHAFTSISNIFGSTYIDNLPTSGLVKINFEIDNWRDLEKGTTEFIITPKELK
ncbi:histidine phosphatase family protein [Winogradskyella echinorum]|uniref:Histidine phosphatase family protein n=1 Tax=Winogradskyella echinorum TaxID=538189 RepID=A0ABR6Y5B8_9FLAO|nr:histidine phosphatase family protein [Winogradskyella echinorum]MBC3847956.1 histidine phosphatase family protein [Winogradskyella echinorum]MBC5752304.1 histidine phosphatase family protein [Winogradskyella echinorum]